MSYRSGDDPQLLSDLRTALKRWRRSTLGEVALARGLADVRRRQRADAWLIRSKALRQAIIAAMTSMRDRGLDQEVDLLERRYLRDVSVIRLADTYHLSERSIYHRLHEAHLALAHALWAQEGAPEASLAAGSARSTPHAQHKPPRTRLLGADRVLAQLLACLVDRDRHWVISLGGMAGRGKTALAREAAGRLAATGRFAEIIWVAVGPGFKPSRNPGQFGLPTLTCGQVLDAIAGHFPGIELDPFDLPAKWDRIRELLLACPCLVVLDNLELVADWGAVADLCREMANPSKFLLTSRHWLESEVEPAVIFVDQLPESEGLALIRHEARERGLAQVVNASDDALLSILAVTRGNPLAIKLVAGQLASLSTGQIVAACTTAPPNSDPYFHHLYRVTWDLISAPAQHLLRSMALLPICEATWDDLLAIGGLSGDELAAAIETLTGYALLQVGGFREETFCLHPLAFHFASWQAGPFGRW